MSMTDRKHDTDMTIEALAYLRDQPDMIGAPARRLDELVRDLESGEMTLAHCGDDECSHGWHYTEHSTLRGVLVDLAGPALATWLSVVTICITVLAALDKITL